MLTRGAIIALGMQPGWHVSSCANLQRNQNVPQSRRKKKKVSYSLFVLVSFSATGRFHSDSPVRCGIETPLRPKHVQIIENALLLFFFSQKKQSYTHVSTLIWRRDARFCNKVPPSELLQIFIVIAFLLMSGLP